MKTFVILFYYGSGTVINYSSGSEFLTSYGPVPHDKKLRFRFHTAKRYGSGSTTLSFMLHTDLQLSLQSLKPVIFNKNVQTLRK